MSPEPGISSTITDISNLEAAKERWGFSELSYRDCRRVPGKSCQADAIMVMQIALSGVEEECANMEEWLLSNSRQMPESDGSFREYDGHVRSQAGRKRSSNGGSTDRNYMSRARRPSR